VNQVEALAQSSLAFREALGCAWIRKNSLPAEIEKRLVLTSGGYLAVLGSSEPWGGLEADGAHDSLSVGAQR
jgi:hypothetical protein